MNSRITVKKMTDTIYLMDDAGEATGYVVLGSEKALVIDTMNGIADVSEVVRRITDLPVMVINTHGHCDHIFGNIYFEEAYLDPADRYLADAHSQFDDFVKFMEENNLKMPPFQDIHDGDLIDIGGETVEIIRLPGHTPGSILLLLQNERVLFTGDAINRHLWLQLDDSLPLEECLENIEKILYLTDKADRILHGHALDFEPIGLINELYDGLKDLCAGNTENDKDYEWWGAGRSKMHTYGRDNASAIIYQERN